MSERAPATARVRFGTFEVDLESGELRRKGVRLKLQEQPFQLLVMFLERPGEVVTREAVRERLWPADTFVDFDHSLNTAIKKLRQVLGDSAENPRFIETLARRGYRFIAPVGTVEAPSQATIDAVPEGTAVDRAEPLLPMTQPPPIVPARPGVARILAIACTSLLVLGAMAWGARRMIVGRGPAATAGAAQAVHLAVLPLQVLTSGETEKYLGVGIADAVITQLANVPTLSVRPTAAVIKYETGAADPRRAGQELNAAQVLSGTLQKSGETYRISMQLIRTADGVPVWGRSYTVARTDLLTIEEQVSHQVADALRVQLRAAGRGHQRRAPRNPAAYESYLQGRALFVNYSEAKMRAAIESFERALQLEPEYALARAGLAISLAWFSVRYAYQKDALYWGRRAEEEAYRALALDHDLAEAHFAIASAAGTVYGKFNWARLLAEVDEALKLDPALDLAYASRARAFYHLGLFEAAHEAASKAIALNPDGNVETHRLLVALSLFTSRFADAAARAEELTRQTDAPVIRMYLGEALFYLGKQKEAAELLASVKRGSEPDVRSQAVLAAVLAATGQKAAAEAMVEALERSPSMDHHIAFSLGTAFAQMGKPDKAVTWLRSSVDDGFPCYPWFAADPLLEPIRRDPGYQKLMAELRNRFDAARSRYQPS
jgi:DNA-binding winged helix-turn-helix (wHTH) protein/TolB-like protein/Tfp pilus assembly protein PilF